MKQIIVIAFLSISFAASAQRHAALKGSIALTLGNPQLTDMQNNKVNTNALKVKQAVQFSLPILNMDQADQTAVGGTVSIDLGDKLTVKKDFDLSRAALNEYFKWETVVTEGKVIIKGTLIKALPIGFDGTAVFELQTLAEGKSTIIMQGVKAGANEKAGDIPVYKFYVTTK